MFRIEMTCHRTGVHRLIELIASVNPDRERFQVPGAVAPHEGDYNAAIEPTREKGAKRYVTDQMAPDTVVEFGAQVAFQLVHPLDGQRGGVRRPVALAA